MASLSHLLLLSLASKCFLLFLLFQQCFPMSTNDALSPIKEICDKTKDSVFCVETLASAPGSATADLKTLGDFSLKQTYGAAANNVALIVSLLVQVTDPGQKQVLSHCKINYDGSIPPLQDAIGALQANQFAEANHYTFMAWQNVNDCDRVIKIGPPPPSLPDQNTRAIKLTDISVVISDMLLD